MALFLPKMEALKKGLHSNSNEDCVFEFNFEKTVFATKLNFKNVCVRIGVS